MSSAKKVARAVLAVLSVACVFASFAITASGQSYVYSVGRPPFTTPEPVESGFINLSNGNVHLEIPLTSSPQRGGQDYSAMLVYDSRIWTIVNSGSQSWQPTNAAAGGWRFMTTVDPGSVSFSTSLVNDCFDPQTQRWLKKATWSNFVWKAPDGVKRTFNIFTEGSNPDCGSIDTDSGDSFATDSTGFHMYVTDFNQATVFAKDGTQVYPSRKDVNGNYFSNDANGNLIDTLGRTPVIKTVSGNLTYYDILDSRNSTPRPRTTVTTTTINVNTNFGQTSVTEYSGTITVVQRIDLPDGTSYVFDYDSGTTAGKFGLVKTITLPTGGTVAYTHTTYSDSYGNRNRWVSSRVAGGGTWAYTPQLITTCGTNCQQKVTVTKPSGDASAYTFTLNSGAWNTQTQQYTGSAASGTLLRTVATDYDYSSGVRTTRITQTLPVPGGNVSKKTEYTYDSPTVANITALKEWTFYTGSPPASPDREADTTYLATTNYLTKDIRNRPLSVTVKNSAAAQVAQTNYTYDSTTLTSITGITHHDDSNFGVGNTIRGNSTLTQRWVAGSVYLTDTQLYDTTGEVIQTVDSKGNNIYLSYADVFYTDNGSNPPAAFTPSASTNAHVTQRTVPIIGAQTFGYYFNTGRRTFSRDQNAADTYYHYIDSLDRLTHIYTPPIVGTNRGWTLIQYTAAAQRDAYSSINDATVSAACSSCKHDRITLDSLGRFVQQSLPSDPLGTTMADETYNSSSQTQAVYHPYRSVSDPTYGADTVSYDGIERIVSVTHPDSNVSRKYYGNAVSSAGGASVQLCSSATYGVGFPVLSLDEAGMKSQQWEDGYGRIIEADEPDASNSLTIGTCYKYDVLGNFTTVVQGSETRTYSFDGLSRKITEVTPEAGTTNYYYTTSGGSLCSGNPQDLCRRTDARSVTVTYTYDALNRVTSRAYSDSTPTVTLFYDQTSYAGLSIANGKGRRTGMSDGSGQTAWSYDANGDVLNEQRTIAGITKLTSYTYNLAPKVASITYPTGHTVAYTYDNAGQQASIVDSGSSINYALSVTYTADGALASSVHGQVSGGFAGITRSYSYNNRLQPNTFQVSSANGTVQSLVYSFDLGGGVNDGNVASVTNTLNGNRTQTFTYDMLNRIATAQSQANSGGDCWGQVYGYDRYGNLLSTTVSKCSAPSLSVSVNAKNQITNSGFGYDNGGNLTNDGSYSYTWDAHNRLTSAAGDTHTYDGDGWRRKSSSGKLYWAGVIGCKDTPLAETDLGGTNAQEFIYLNCRRIARREASATVYYYFDDYLRSARVLTDSTGHTVRESDYFPFGGERVITNTVANGYEFTGKRRDSSTGLDYSVFRMYSSTLGRWLSPDPLRGMPGDPQNLNLYSYVLNAPTSYMDTLGAARDDEPTERHGNDVKGHAPGCHMGVILISWIFVTIECDCVTDTPWVVFGRCAYTCNCTASDGMVMAPKEKTWTVTDLKKHCVVGALCPVEVETRGTAIKLGTWFGRERYLGVENIIFCGWRIRP